MIWREKRILLAALGALFAFNVVFFFTYRIRYQERVNDLQTRLESAESELNGARGERLRAEQRFALYQQLLRNIDTIHEVHWSTPEARLTKLILEVRRLASKSGLGMPRSISYDQAEGASGNRATGTTTMTISFTVQGSYQQVRRLLNLIELSEQFMIIDEIALSDSAAGPSTIQLSIRLKTLFHEPLTGKTS